MTTTSSSTTRAPPRPCVGEEIQCIDLCCKKDAFCHVEKRIDGEYNSWCQERTEAGCVKVQADFCFAKGGHNLQDDIIPVPKNFRNLSDSEQNKYLERIEQAWQAVKEPHWIELPLGDGDRHQRCWRWDVAGLDESLCDTENGFAYTDDPHLLGFDEATGESEHCVHFSDCLLLKEDAY